MADYDNHGGKVPMNYKTSAIAGAAITLLGSDLLNEDASAQNWGDSSLRTESAPSETPSDVAPVTATPTEPATDEESTSLQGRAEMQTGDAYLMGTPTSPVRLTGGLFYQTPRDGDWESKTFQGSMRLSLDLSDRVTLGGIFGAAHLFEDAEVKPNNKLTLANAGLLVGLSLGEDAYIEGGLNMNRHWYRGQQHINAWGLDFLLNANFQSGNNLFGGSLAINIPGEFSGELKAYDDETGDHIGSLQLRDWEDDLKYERLALGFNFEHDFGKLGLVANANWEYTRFEDMIKSDMLDLMVGLPIKTELADGRLVMMPYGGWRHEEQQDELNDDVSVANALYLGANATWMPGKIGVYGDVRLESGLQGDTYLMPTLGLVYRFGYANNGNTDE